MPSTENTVSCHGTLDVPLNIPPPLYLHELSPTTVDIDSGLDSLDLTNATEEVNEPVGTHKDTIEDYRVKYDLCYGILYDTVVRVDFFDTVVDGRDVAHYNKLVNGVYQGGISEDVESFVEDVDWTLPELGAINYKDTVVFLTRNHKQHSPSRYRLAFRYDIVEAYEPTYKEYGILGRSPIVSNGSIANHLIINKIFFKDVFTCEQALDSVLSFRRLGAAFSPNLYFTASASTNSFLLWRRDMIIGVYNKTKKRFKLMTDMFDDELSEYNIPTIGFSNEN